MGNEDSKQTMLVIERRVRVNKDPLFTDPDIDAIDHVMLGTIGFPS